MYRQTPTALWAGLVPTIWYTTTHQGALCLNCFHFNITIKWCTNALQQQTYIISLSSACRISARSKLPCIPHHPSPSSFIIDRQQLHVNFQAFLLAMFLELIGLGWPSFIGLFGPGVVPAINQIYIAIYHYTIKGHV